MKRNFRDELEKHLSFPYRIELIPDKEDGGYVAMIPDLPGCLAQGETQIAALQGIAEAKKLWMEAELEAGRKIPMPREQYSGKFNVRIPKTLHARIAQEAARDGVSLNTEVISVMERGLAQLS